MVYMVNIIQSISHLASTDKQTTLSLQTTLDARQNNDSASNASIPSAASDKGEVFVEIIIKFITVIIICAI